jgi:hypothetical protein
MSLASFLSTISRFSLSIASYSGVARIGLLEVSPDRLFFLVLPHAHTVIHRSMKDME